MELSSNPFLLIINDDKISRQIITQYFGNEGFGVLEASDIRESIELLNKFYIPIIICDIKIISSSETDLFEYIKENQFSTAIIFYSSFSDVDGAMEAFKRGAFDYIKHPFELNSLKKIVERALRHTKIMSSSVFRLPVPKGNEINQTIVGQSPKFVEIYKKVARAALSSSNVLIRGEAGTGKKLIAKAIHQNGPRKEMPFVSINCAALPSEMLELELFGKQDSSKDKKNSFVCAEGGTLFLDEINHMNPTLQIKLLRILQEEKIEIAGETPRKINVRLITSCNCDLETLIKKQEFRQDLHYRLNTLKIKVPPLRERIEDLPELVNHFLLKYSEKSNTRVSALSEDAEEMLKKYSWPGNIRELENAIEQALNLSNSSVLYPEDFPEEINTATLHKRSIQGPELKHLRLEEVEREHILKILRQTNYNKSKAAIILGIDRTTLQRKAKKFGISLQRE